VERHQRGLDGEGGEEAEEQPALRAVALGQVAQGLVVEAAAAVGLGRHVPQGDDGHQHEQPAEQGVEEELDRGVDTLLPAPGADQEVGGDQHGLPEDVEQEQVEGDEHAEHGGLERQQGGDVAAGAVGHAPGADDGQRREQGGEQQQGQADAVDPDLVAHPQGAHPVGLLAELEARLATVEQQRQRHRQAQDHQADRQAHPLRQRPGLGLPSG
jgi:hypothetical protein